MYFGVVHSLLLCVSMLFSLLNLFWCLYALILIASASSWLLYPQLRTGDIPYCETGVKGYIVLWAECPPYTIKYRREGTIIPRNENPMFLDAAYSVYNHYRGGH